MWEVWAALAVALIVCWYQSSSQALDVDDLRVKLEQAERDSRKLDAYLSDVQETLEDIPGRLLVLVAEGELALGQYDRISLYRYRSEDRCFVGLARFAMHTPYSAWRRRTYPEDEGFISQAWRNGIYYIEDLPSPDNFDEYVSAVQSRAHIDRSVLKEMRMKSRAYFCVSLRHQHRQVAVLVIETTQPRLPKSTESLKRWASQDIAKHLAEMVVLAVSPGRSEKGGT